MYVLVYVCGEASGCLCGCDIVYTLICTYNAPRSYYWNSCFLWTLIRHHKHINPVSGCLCDSLVQEK